MTCQRGVRDLFGGTVTDLVVTTEAHLLRTPRGEYFVEGSESYAFFTRYLEAFDSVTVVARTTPIDAADRHHHRVDGDGVNILELPEFRTIRSAIAKYPSARKAIIPRLYRGRAEVWLLRVPGVAATVVWSVLRRNGASFGVEVVSDPHDALRGQSGATFAMRAARLPFETLLKRVISDAAVAAYVTKEALQRRYPARGWSTWYSSVDLPPESFEKAELRFQRMAQEPDSPSPFRIVFVGRLWRKFKGLDTLVDSVLLLSRSQDVMVDVVGGGPLQTEYEQLVRQRGLADRFCFHGEIASAESLSQILLGGHLFVLPTRREGLPRALLEAMAHGLPCVATTIGGIPELLQEGDLVPPDDALNLARRIGEFMSSRDRRIDAGKRNWSTAREYERSVLQARRRELYGRLDALAGVTTGGRDG